MRIVDIIDGTSVDGPGFRTSIYFAGCDHACPGCHNPSTWPFDSGRDMDVDEVMARIVENDFDVTFSGGDPLYQASDLLPLAKAIRRAGKSIWIYTGFHFEQAVTNPDMLKLIKLAEVVVDGPFVESLLDYELLFRGSSNQRLIDVERSLSAGQVVEWNSDLAF